MKMDKVLLLLLLRLSRLSARYGSQRESSLSAVCAAIFRGQQRAETRRRILFYPGQASDFIITTILYCT